MGTFVFKWEHPANEVFVTGTFDDWNKTQKLDKKGDIFEKEVTLPISTDKIYYKFVVDGNWITDHTAPQENDQSGNLNNFLTPERISPVTATMSGVTPQSTTAQLAGEVPKENNSNSESVPGAFPETPAAEPASFGVNPIPASEGAGNPVQLAPGEAVPPPSEITSNTITSGVHDDQELKAADQAKSQEQTFSVNPIPGTDGPSNPVTLPAGESVPPPSDFTTNTVTSGVHDDEELKAADQAKTQNEQTFSVNPIPASAGPGNPIKLTAGEPIPPQSEITSNTINSTVRTDEASYNASDAGPPVLPPVITPAAEREAKGTGVLDLPPISKTLIPESSLPMGEEAYNPNLAAPLMQSAAPTSTTAQLAGQVPLEKDIKLATVPDIVKESQEQAGVPPEASAIPREVAEKKEVEEELLHEVKKAPVTSDGTTTEVKVTAQEAATAVGGALAAVGGAAVAYATTAKDKVVEATQNAPSVEQVKEQLPEPIKNAVAPAATTSTTDEKVADVVPEPVKESIAEAHTSPEAAAYTAPIAAKESVEAELLKKVDTETASGEPAPKADDATAVKDDEEINKPADFVPEPVRESIYQAHASPEAAAYRHPVVQKEAMEGELLKKVPTNQSHGEPAPKIAGGASSVEKKEDIPDNVRMEGKDEAEGQGKEKLAAVLSPQTQAQTQEPKSRDISPGTMPGGRRAETAQTEEKVEKVDHSHQTKPVVTEGGKARAVPEVSKPSTSAPSTVPADLATAAPKKSGEVKRGQQSSEESAASSAGNGVGGEGKTSKKEKRRSFFGRIKDKLKDL